MSQESGAKAEDAAAAYLERQGLKILNRNYRCRYGEIDLICRDGSTLVFVEVRLRTSARYGGAAASITSKKQGRLLTAARHYLSSLGSMPECRFDALLIEELQTGQMQWIRNAFGE
ncbi:MAG: YraN family protein [Burkholderiales bacterium]|nr:YraN family protein [Sulfuricellaceae bacterium]